MVSNPGLYSRFTTGSSLGQILDAADAPHTGLIKALSLGLGQNYAISGFNITKNSVTALAVASGKIIRDGELVSVSATSSDLTLTANVYHLIVVDSSDNIVIRTGTSTTVPDYTAGDVIIAAAKHDSTEAHIQYLTLGKTENSISIAQPTTGSATYTEEGKISAPSGASVGQGIDIETVASHGDIRITPQGNGETVIKNIKATGDVLVPEFIKHDGDSDTYVRMESDSIRVVAGNVEFLNMTENGASSALVVGDGSTSIDFRVESDNETDMLFVDASADGVGIGTNAPDATLHVRGSTSPTVRIQEDGENGYLDIIGLSDSQSSIKATNNTGSEVAILDITSKCASTGTGQEVRIFRDARTTADGTFTLKRTGTNTNAFKFTCDKDGTDHEFIADADVKIGGTSSPSVALDVTGEFRLSSHAELNGDLNHDGSNIGFFGTAVAAQQSVGNMGSSSVTPAAPGFVDPAATQLFSPNQEIYLQGLETEIGNLRTKVDALIDALQLYGLIT